MDAMAPDMLDRYRELQKSNQEIVENITRSQQLYDQTAGELRAAEAAVEGDRFRREVGGLFVVAVSVPLHWTSSCK